MGQNLTAMLPAWPTAAWWLIAGGVLLCLELLVPGIFLMWFGLAAIAVAIVVFALAPALPTQLLLFAVFSLIAGVFGWRWYRRAVAHDHGPVMEPGTVYTGQVATVVEPLRHGRGKVRLHDSLWLAEGKDADVGAAVRVTGQHGSVLLVTTE
jgi:membrane protein implicated in regulation of membrane protease activity